MVLSVVSEFHEIPREEGHKDSRENHPRGLIDSQRHLAEFRLLGGIVGRQFLVEVGNIADHNVL